MEMVVREESGAGGHRYRVRKGVFVLHFAHIMSTMSNLAPSMSAHQRSFMNKHMQQNSNVS